MASHLAVTPAQAGVHKLELRIKRLESVIASPEGLLKSRKNDLFQRSEMDCLSPLGVVIVSQKYDIRGNNKEEIQGLLGP